MSQDDLQLPDDVEQFKALVAGQAVAMAERDASLTERESVLAQQAAMITQHETTITQHETIIDSLHETIEKQLRKLEGLHQQLARLLRKQYGPQKERIDPDQLTLFSAAELESLVAELSAAKHSNAPETIANNTAPFATLTHKQQTPRSTKHPEGPST